MTEEREVAFSFDYDREVDALMVRCKRGPLEYLKINGDRRWCEIRCPFCRDLHAVLFDDFYKHWIGDVDKIMTCMTGFNFVGPALRNAVCDFISILDKERKGLN